MNRKALTSFWIFIGLAIVISIGLPLVLYNTHFANNGISGKTNDWANFSTFWNVFISLGNSIVLIFLTFVFQKYQTQRQVKDARPIIGLKRSESSYDIVNVGKGSALNIRAFTASDTDLKSGKFTNKYYCYSLEPNAIFKGKWISGTMILIEYTDIFDSLYYTMMEGNHLYVFNEKQEPLLKSNQTDLKKATENFKGYMKFDRSNPQMPPVQS